MKSVKMKVGVLVVSVACVSILIWIFVARTPAYPSPSEAELENYFGDSSCSWPCWQGITPGITTSDDALQLLQTSALVLQSTVQTESLKTGFGNARWEWNIGDVQPSLGGDMDWRDGIVYDVGLIAYPTFSIGKVISRFGPPDKIHTDDCTEIPEGEHRYLCAVFHYNKNGFEIHIVWEAAWNENDTQITPSDPVSFVVLFEPTTIEEWVTNYGGDPQTLNLQDWKGYGNLYDLYFR